jgi:membrane-bound lytic murein transglycosylase F
MKTSGGKYELYPFISLLSFLFIFTACNTENPDNQTEEKYPPPIATDLPDIKENGKLVAITSYSATSYFIYKGQPMGYEYELLQQLADDLGLELEINIAEDLDNFISLLNEGEGDLVAHNLSITKERLQYVDFTEPHNTTHQVLVQRKPDNWRDMKLHNIENQLIRDPNELIGKSVYVREQSAYYQRLKNLSEEIGGDINIIPVEGSLSTETLIQKVAEGEYEYTVADDYIADLNHTYYQNLDVETQIGFPQRLAWMVRKTSPKLKEAINQWIEKAQESADYFVVYNKYFKNEKAFKRRVSSEYFSLTGGKISSYDETIRQYAQEINWDWKLLASQIYQESRFDPKTKSWAGARGLMQLMPRTAADMGDYDLYDPEQSIEAGVKFIQYLEEQFVDIPNPDEKLKFVLAAYNAGAGHIQDAQRLAEKHGANPMAWTNNVDQYILLKSQKKYYNDPVVKYGYCRGEEPYNYVNEILKRHETYSELIKEEEAIALVKG